MSHAASPTIWTAARQGDLPSVRAILAHTPSAVHKQDPDGCTALHHAALGGSDDVLEFLLELGADPDARALAGHTPMLFAAFGDCESCFRQLRDAGADIHAVNDSLTTVLHGAAASGASDILDELLEEGFAPDIANLYGELPAHRAAQADQLETVQRLLELGSKQNPIDRYDMSLLHKAAIGGATQTVEWLLDEGFDPLAGDLVGNTPMHSAAAMARQSTVELLLSRGISSDLRNYDEATPLHAAAGGGHLSIVELLLKDGADGSAMDVLARTPLHMAAIRGHTEIVKHLLESEGSGASLDVNGHRPIELAALYGRAETWEILSSRHAEPALESTPAIARQLAQKPVATGEMLVWYLGHSGWAVRTARHLFIIDYAPGEPEREDTSLVNGRIDPAAWGDLTVLVLVSHHHADHFDRRILEWQHPGLRIVYGWDAPEELPGFRFAGQEIKRIGDVMIGAIPATDAGSAFLIEADGVSFYHAGDHAADKIPPEPAFTTGVEWLADQFSPIQAAFLPVFGCGLPSPDTLQAGNAFTIDKLSPVAVLPMHIGWSSYFYRQFERWICNSDLSVGLGIADQPGDRFIVRQGTIEKVWI